MKYGVFLIVILFQMSLSGQNRLLNPSFEDGDFNYSELFWWNYHYRLNHWKDDIYIGPLETGHSPDWIPPPPGGLHGTPFGDYYVRFAQYELVQQELTFSRKFVAGTPYLVSLYIYLENAYHVSTQTNTYENYDLRFYVSKNKIRYSGSHEVTQCDLDYQTIDNVYIREVGNFDMDVFPNQEWIPIKFIYIEPESSTSFNDYNWFGLDLRKNVSGSCYGEKVAIDQVSIEEIDYCTFSACSRTDGPEVASWPYRYRSPMGPVAVDNLNNIEKAENIVIRNVLSQPIRYLSNVESINGLDYPIFWDGKDNNGNKVLPAPYIWQMDLINECGTQSYSKQFTLIEEVNEVPPTFPEYSFISTPRPCCTESLDINIDQNVSGSGLIEFIAVESVTLSNMTVSSDVTDMIVQGGSRITIGPGVIIEKNARVTFIIENCLFPNQ